MFIKTQEPWHLLAVALIAAVVPCAAQNRPDATLVTADIENFWRAYDAGQPGDRTAAFQRLYFEPASPGLAEFIDLRIGSALTLGSTVDRFSKFYASIRKNTVHVSFQRETILLYSARFRGLYPASVFPPVYFVIGKASTGGTLGKTGLLIGTEVFSLGADVDVSEIRESSPAFLRSMGSAEKLPLIVIHELVHARVKLASRPNLPNLLTASLIEGGADYITSLVSGRIINDYKAEYAERHRERLFGQFAQDLAATPDALEKWLYNYNLVPDDVPADLGYWIGEEICCDYFAMALDKDSAVNAIMTMLAPESIVRGSSYAWLLDSRKGQ